jgi:outer membrane protein assembly factor BamB
MRILKLRLGAIACGTVLSACHRDSGPTSALTVDHAARVVWHVAGDGNPAAPAYDGTKVYFLDNTHQIVAIDAQKGTKAWTTNINTTSDYLQLGGCVIAGPAVACAENDIVGVRRSDGQLLWRFTPTPGIDPVFTSLTVVGSTIIAGSSRGTAYAIDGTSGATVWSVRPFPADTEAITIWDPNSDGTIVVAAYTKFWLTKPSTGGILAIDAATGKTLWTSDYPLPDDHTIGTNAVSTALWSDVVLGVSNAAGTIYAMNRATGAVVWSLPGAGLTSPGAFPGVNAVVTQDLRSLLVIGNTLYTASLSGWFIAYDLPSRTEKWRVSMPNSNTLNRLASDGASIDVQLAGGQLYAFSGAKPLILWATSGLPNEFLSFPVVGGGMVFANRRDGFYALSAY